jgi:hypothetical protein
VSVGAGVGRALWIALRKVVLQMGALKYRVVTAPVVLTAERDRSGESPVDKGIRGRLSVGGRG